MNSSNILLVALGLCWSAAVLRKHRYRIRNYSESRQWNEEGGLQADTNSQQHVFIFNRKETCTCHMLRETAEKAQEWKD